MIRHIQPNDYDKIIPKLDDWWGRKQMTDKLPRLFFDHFSDTSFIIEEKGLIKGFLIGFISPANPTIGYVHFIGVNPDFRKEGIGRKLYSAFIEKAEPSGVTVIECLTSPENRLSITFHKKIGFSIKPGDGQTEDGFMFTRNYDGPGEHRVLFNISTRKFRSVNNSSEHHETF
ncbi:GNAT family N-acetyltransferase [Cytophagaceae bacterium ABcell3]|nr:GNAT family N-acetyltransferase [Cytophagaceae bacterium ABcell3]